MNETSVVELTTKLRECLARCTESLDAYDKMEFSEIIDSVVRSITLSLSSDMDFEEYGIDVDATNNICGQFGSISSTDLDFFVALSTPMSPSFLKHVREYLTVWIQGMIDARDLAYNKPDIQFITVGKDGYVTWAEKGNITEINNAIYYTYNHHFMNNVLSTSKLRPCPVKVAVKPEIGIKALKTVRSLITFLSRTEFTEELTPLLFNNTLSDRIDGILVQYDNGKVLSNIESFNKPNHKDSDILKSIAFGFVQLDQMINNTPIIYQKEAIITSDYLTLSPLILSYESTASQHYDVVSTLDDLVRHVLISLLSVIEEENDGVLKITGDQYSYSVRKESPITLGEDYICSI